MLTGLTSPALLLVTDPLLPLRVHRLLEQPLPSRLGDDPLRPHLEPLAAIAPLDRPPLRAFRLPSPPGSGHSAPCLGPPAPSRFQSDLGNHKQPAEPALPGPSHSQCTVHDELPASVLYIVGFFVLTIVGGYGVA